MDWALGESVEGSNRFTVRRRLGAGGMGVVYEAYDHLAKQRVALKTLIHAEASAVYRLKNEFRSLANIAHPNLVSLFELFMEGDVCFFTMELLDGVDFVRHARGFTLSDNNAATVSLHSATRAACTSDGPSRASPQQASATPIPTPEFKPPASSSRVRDALRQLADGLCALHDGGKLHRDVKPSNILVTGANRVVILDFGLSTEFLTADVNTGGFAGTPAYMSPEQMEGRALSPASDWYSVGVTLYEALTGQLPYQGGYFEVITKKRETNPIPPSKLADSAIDADLEELCLALLHRDPAARPSGRQILERLNVKSNSGLTTVPQSVSVVGREGHLAKLQDAFRAAKRGATVKVYIHGSSGMGKSTLVQSFVRQLEDEEQVLVLAGRCYERESIPYKALDGVVDHLSHYLSSLSKERLEAVLPRDVAPMTKMFPVLGRVKAIGSYYSSSREGPDPQTVRQRAVTSLRELLGRISVRLPLLIFIDDLHWSDADSLVLLENLLRPPDAPAALLLATFRTEEIRTTPFLRSLLDQAGAGHCIEMRVGGLTGEEARRLTRSLLGGENAVNDQFVETVVREAQGNPFLIEQLVCWAASTSAVGADGISVTEMLDALMRLLPEGAHGILETLAIAAQPVSAEVLFRAAGLSENTQPIVAVLRRANLLRSSGTAQKLELYHDRIRESIASLVDPDRTRRIHRNLAESLTAVGFDDPEVLFEHYVRAGELEPAAKYAKLAGLKAAAALAFDRAAVFYRSALTLLPPDSGEAAELQPRLGEALANAGRSAEAAAAYLDAAKGCEKDRALDLQRRAAEQLLLGGHVDEGLDVIRAVLSRVGLRLVSGPKTALLSLLVRRLELRLRGLRFKERPLSDISAPELLRIDICWAVAAGLAMVDNVRGADFQTRHLLLALRAGEPYRIARALAVEAGFSATSGAPGRRRAVRFSRIAEQLSGRVAHPHAIGLAKLTAGVAEFLVGEWKRSFELCEISAAILRDQCTAVLWELTSAQNFALGSLLYLGEVAEIKRRLPSMLATADERGNLYAATELKTRMNFFWLAADDPDGARRELAEALQLWSHKGFHRQHYNALLAEAQIALYRGDGGAAWECVTSRWPDLRRAMLLSIQVLRIEALFLKARSALAIVERNPTEAPVLLKEAARIAHKIAREQMRWSDPLASLLLAGIASLRGDRGRAAALLSRTIPGFESADMALHAAVARWRLGEMQSMEQSIDLVEQAREWMTSQEVKNPEAMVGMLAPGFLSRAASSRHQGASSAR